MRGTGSGVQAQAGEGEAATQDKSGPSKSLLLMCSLPGGWPAAKAYQWDFYQGYCVDGLHVSASLGVTRVHDMWASSVSSAFVAMP